MRKLLFIGIAIFAMESEAAVQEYQVNRLILMKSDCVKTDLVRTDKPDGSIEFMASCKNLSHFPDGLRVICSDAENERSCKIATMAKQFDSLSLLQSSE